MKVTFITYAYRRPDFIILQYNSIKKHVKGVEIDYIVYNNDIELYGAESGVGLGKQISDICEKLEITCIDVKLDSAYNFRNTGGHYYDSEKKYQTGPCACSYPLVWSWDDICKKNGIVVIIDSDMFFVKDINIEEMMLGKDLAFIPQYKQDFKIFYMWNGLVFLNMDTLKNVEEINWGLGMINGGESDVGAFTCHYLEKYIDQTNCIFLEAFGFCDLEQNLENKKYGVTLNGNVYHRIVTKGGDIESFVDLTTDKDMLECGASSYFPYEVERENYVKYLFEQFEKINHLLNDKGINLPDPPYVDFIKTRETNVDESFVLHYKSGSNYLPFQTEEYNEKKTKELRKMIFNSL